MPSVTDLWIFEVRFSPRGSVESWDHILKPCHSETHWIWIPRRDREKEQTGTRVIAVITVLFVRQTLDLVLNSYDCVIRLTWWRRLSLHDNSGRHAQSFLPRHALCKRGLCCRLVSVCLSVTLVDCIQTAKDIVKLLSRPSNEVNHHSSFWPPALVPNSKGNPFSGDAKYEGWDFFAIFDWNRRLSRKW